MIVFDDILRKFCFCNMVQVCDARRAAAAIAQLISSAPLPTRFGGLNQVYGALLINCATAAAARRASQTCTMLQKQNLRKITSKTIIFASFFRANIQKRHNVSQDSTMFYTPLDRACRVPAPLGVFDCANDSCACAGQNKNFYFCEKLGSEKFNELVLACLT